MVAMHISEVGVTLITLMV